MKLSCSRAVLATLLVLSAKNGGISGFVTPQYGPRSSSSTFSIRTSSSTSSSSVIVSAVPAGGPGGPYVDLSVVSPGVASQIDELQRQVTAALDSAAFALPTPPTELLQAYQELLSKGSALLDQIISSGSSLGIPSSITAPPFAAELLQKVTAWEQSVALYMQREQPILLPFYNQAQVMAKTLLQQVDGLPTPVIVLGSAYVSYIVISSVLGLFGPAKAAPPTRPYPLNKYDPVSAKLYFDERPLAFLKRGVEVTLLSLAWGAKFLQDRLRYVSRQSHRFIIAAGNLVWIRTCMMFRKSPSHLFSIFLTYYYMHWYVQQHRGRKW
jgi:hypothetical protein